MAALEPGADVKLPHDQPSKNGPLQVEKLEQNEDVATAEALDWRGRPATQKHGGPKTAPFILVSQGLWSVANAAVSTNLVLYFVRVLQMSNASAANNVTNWFGTQFLLTLLGGFLGDAYWGRFKTCMVFQVVHIVGLVILALSVTVSGLKPPVCGAGLGGFCPMPSSLQTIVFFVGLYIIALGSGGYLPAFLTWGADQYDSEKQKTNFFGWLLVSLNVGSVLANTVFVWLENNGGWALGFWLATGTGTLAFLVFGGGIPVYRQFRPSGNSFARLAHVLVASARKWRLEVPQDSSKLHELPEKQLLQQGFRKLTHTPKFRFFDKAAIRVTGEIEEPWRLCNVTQVEELKCLCSLLPIWLCAFPYAVMFSLLNTLFVEQAAIMDLSLGSMKIPPASISLVNIASIFVMTLIFPWTVVPVARMITGRPSGMTQLQRVGWGQVIVVLGMAVSALVERKRLMLAREGEQMSVFWLSPQQILLGASQVFGAVGAMDFFYTAAPHSIRGVVSCLSLAIFAIGNYLSTALVTITMHFTTKGGSPGWIPASNLNLGHVDYFYWLLMCITFLNLFAFMLACWWYRRCARLLPTEYQEIS